MLRNERKRYMWVTTYIFWLLILLVHYNWCFITFRCSLVGFNFNFESMIFRFLYEVSFYFDLHTNVNMTQQKSYCRLYREIHLDPLSLIDIQYISRKLLYWHKIFIKERLRESHRRPNVTPYRSRWNPTLLSLAAFDCTDIVQLIFDDIWLGMFLV